MKTVIDNNSRVFQIVTSTATQVFCNLQDIPKVLQEINAVEGYYKINHFWNNKAKKCSKKLLNDMFKSAKIDVNNKIFTIDMYAKEWFDKVNGNSYHAGEVIVNYGKDNEQTFTYGLTYGYDDFYKQSSFDLLVKNNVLPVLTRGELHEYIKNNNIQVKGSIKRDCKKSELSQYK